MTGITLIIPTYNRSLYLSQTLRSISELVVPEGLAVELLVIDNNCTDRTSAVVAEASRNFPFPIRSIIEKQQGLSFARNRGITEAKFDDLAYLDDDILISPQWIVSYFEARRVFEADAVVGPVFPLFEQSQPSFLHGLALTIISSGYSRKGETPQRLPHEMAHELPGCNFGVTRLMARQLNGFITSLGRTGKGMLAGEDSDFGLRLVAAGGRTAYHPGCWIKHVMVQEKLSKSYLRQRAFGIGATRRRMKATSPTLWNHFRGTLGAGRLWGKAIWSYLIRHPEAFNRELDAQLACGYLWG